MSHWQTTIRSLLSKLLNKLPQPTRKYAKKVKTILAPIWMFGTRYTCPVCDSHFRAFQSFVTSYYLKGELVDHTTKNAICPRCESDMRQRFLVAFLKLKTDLFERPYKILEFAPNMGLYYFLKSHPNLD